MILTKSKTKIGPYDHGRKMSLKAFEFAETEEGRKRIAALIGYGGVQLAITVEVADADAVRLSAAGR